MECQVEKKTNISDTLFYSSVLEELKQRKRPETFAPMVKALLQDGFLVSNRVIIISMPCPERTLHFNEDGLNTLIHDEPHQTTRELTNVMGCDHLNIARHVLSMGKVQKLGAWIP